jgi:hypothetical protein
MHACVCSAAVHVHFSAHIQLLCVSDTSSTMYSVSIFLVIRCANHHTNCQCELLLCTSRNVYAAGAAAGPSL